VIASTRSVSRDEDCYGGVDNLEAMEEAVRYNAFLAREVAREALPNRLIVDFGAGVGTFARPLHQRGVRVLCVENDPHLGARLCAEGLAVEPSIDALADASIDYLYSLNVLEHIEDDEACVQAWYAKLRPGAPLLLYVPAFMILYSEMDRRIGHYRRYRRQPLVQLLEGAGFHVRYASYVDSLGFFASLGLRFLDRSGGVLNPRMVRLYDRVAFPVSRLLDRAMGPVLGKNVLIRATKPA
jgi:SAM-dependent methyltransferase